LGLTVAWVATIALAVPAASPQDAAGLRAQSDALYASGDFRGALEAADRARLLDPEDPWVRYAWVHALAAVDPDSARRQLASAPDFTALMRLPDEDRARLETEFGYLCLDLGIEPLAATYFDAVPETATSHARAQAGLAILAVRRGNARLALAHFDAARAAVRLDPSLAELERDARYEVVLHEFTTARDLRDANAAARAYATLDELRPNHPSTLQARADLANLRGDMPARERALRDLLAVDPRAPQAANQLIDTLLSLNRPHDAFMVAHDVAPERLASDAGLQEIERAWVSHLEVALDGRWRNGITDHDRLVLSRIPIAWTTSDPGWGRLRIVATAEYPESDRVPAGEPFGSLVALPAISEPQSAQGVGGLLQWAPRSGLTLELGSTPTAFEVSNVVGAIRYRKASDAGTFMAGLDRQPVEDSLLSYAGTVDPGSRLAWGGVVRNRGYIGGSFGTEALQIYGGLAGAVLDGERVDSNSEWRADGGFLQRAMSGEAWVAHLGGAIELVGHESNRSHFTLGHGGYFSPERFVAVGPVFNLEGRQEDRSFRLEGGVLWQELHEEPSPYFPTDDALQASSGDPRYPGDSRDGLGIRVAASLEWRVSERSVAGVRLEGARGEDAKQVRLQVYVRRWDHRVTDPVQTPPVPMRMREFYALN